MPCVHLQGTRIEQHQHRKVDERIGERVHQCADAAYEALHARESRVLLFKSCDFRIFPRKRAQHARAAERFAGFAQHAVE